MVSFKVDNEILLRELTTQDAAPVFNAAIRNREHLGNFMHWMTPSYSIDSAREFIAQSIENRAEKKRLSLGIFRGEEFIGSIGFVKFDWTAQTAEIGYWISAAEEGKGIITRSTRILIDFAFRELDLNRVEIRCASENIRSSAIPTRLGFTHEGRLRQALMRNGRLHDLEIFGLLASEWEG